MSTLRRFLGLVAGLVVTASMTALPASAKKGSAVSAPIYGFSVRTIEGHEKSLGDYQGKVMLIVNTASKCGFTPQYEGLEKLQAAYHEKGLEVLGFPCNQFGSQEPGSSKEISEFCTLTYGVKFQMFEKVEVNGKGEHPLYRYLKDQKPGLMGLKDVKWNFTKFLVDREGKVVERYAPQTEPADIAKAIEALLAKG